MWVLLNILNLHKYKHYEFKNKNLGSYYVAEHDQKVVGLLLITKLLNYLNQVKTGITKRCADVS